MTRKLIERTASPQAEMTTLEEAVKPALDALAKNDDQELNKRLRKLSQVSNEIQSIHPSRYIDQ